MAAAFRSVVKKRLAAEQGRVEKSAPVRVALAYPSRYHVAMSSLGYQTIYRALQSMPEAMCERAFLPDDEQREGPLLTYESLSGLQEFSIVAFSVAYELELAGLVTMLEAAGIAPERAARSEREPFVLVGGPLTFSNPLPLSVFADAVILGEAEGITEWAVRVIESATNRASMLRELADHPNVFVPAIHHEKLPSIAACDDALLPAKSAIITPHTELSNMFLVETERGCSRGCTYCVMRRSTNGGMRLVQKERILESVPEHARKVGLVGAAVSDHPRIVEIVNDLCQRGLSVSLSSLRPDRLKEEFVRALKRAGYRTLTTALDGPSERLRGILERRGREEHYVRAAERARENGMDRLKLYLMLGLPGETDEDIDECVRFVSELSHIVPIALSIAPFCAKRNTPLDRTPFAGVKLVHQRLTRLRRGLKGRADVRSTSARWAWVEYVLAQGGIPEAHALLSAVRSGGRFADYRREFERIGWALDGSRQAPEVASARSEPSSSEPLRRRLSVVPAG